MDALISNEEAYFPRRDASRRGTGLSPISVIAGRVLTPCSPRKPRRLRNLLCRRTAWTGSALRSTRARETVDAAVVLATWVGGSPLVVLGRRAGRERRGQRRNLGWRDDDRWLLCLPRARGGLSVLTRCLSRGARSSSSALRSGSGGRCHHAPSGHVALVVPSMLRALLEHDRRAIVPPARDVVGGARASPSYLPARHAESASSRATADRSGIPSRDRASRSTTT